MRRVLTDRRFVLAALLALACGIWLQRLGIDDYNDAVSNEVIFTRKPLARVVFRMQWHDQSPLYFVALKAWKVFPETPFWVRMLSVVVMLGAVVLFHRVARELSGHDGVAHLATLLFVISPVALWLVRRGRMYPLFVVLSLASLLYFARFLARGRIRDALALAVVCSLNVYNHFFGLVVTGVIFLVWFGRAAFARRKEAWIAPALTAAVCQFLVLPQLVRLARLLGAAAPQRNVLSLPGLFGGYLRRVYGFGFFNADWGEFAAAAPVYLAAIAFLATLGARRLTRPLQALAAVWAVGIVLVLGIAAAHVDLRDRYFVFVPPLVWILAALGARGVQLRRARLAALVIVLAGTAWLTWRKVPEQAPQWTKLMTAIDRLGLDEPVLYMRPGPDNGMPRAVVDHQGLDPALRRIRMITGATMAMFRGEIAGGKPIVFLYHAGHETPEQRRRVARLEEKGYAHLHFDFRGAVADVYTPAPREGLARTDRVSPASHAAFVAWARSRPRPDGNADLARALLARLRPDGTVEESTFFVSQRGEDGYWLLGPDDTDALTRAGETFRVGVRPGAVLLVSLPGEPLGRELVIAGESDPALVRGELWVGDALAAEVESGTVDTTRWRGRDDATLLLATAGEPTSVLIAIRR